MSFERESPRVMGEISASFSLVLAEAKVPPRAAEIVSRLKLDKTQAWHLAEVAGATVPLLMAEHVPGELGMRAFLKAARSRGTSEKAAARADNAVKKFWTLLESTAEDRMTFESMLADLARTRYNSRSYESARREAYRANVAIFGFSAATQFQVDFLAPSEAEGTLDFCVLRAYVGLTRFHSDARWHFGRTRTHKGGVYDSEAWPRPLEPKAIQKFNAPLIPQFCGPNMPSFFQAQDPLGGLNQYITQGPLGLRGAFDVVMGEYARGVGHVRALPDDDEGECFVPIYTPARMFIHDMLIHRDLLEGPWRGIYPESILFGELHSGQFHPHGDRHKHRLPIEPRPGFNGPAVALPVVPDLPRHGELLAYACKKMKWKLDAFDAFRVRMPYPPTPSTAAQRFRLPQ
jgi:hypothetical protein